MNRKNVLSALMAVMMVLSMLTAVALPAVAESEAPADAVPVTDVTSNANAVNFTVSTLSDLLYLANNYTRFVAGDTVYMLNDLDIATYEGDFAADFPSIGVGQDAGKFFAADFDGLNHTISNYRDSVGFFKGVGGAIRNVNFENCSTTGGANEAVIVACNSVAKNGALTMENVKAINCSVVSETNVANVGIVIGYQNGGTRNLTVRNCAVLNCTIDVLGQAEANGYGSGLFSARWAAGGTMIYENVLIANSKLHAYADSAQGGGLLIGDIDPKENNSDCLFTANNIGFINVEMKNKASDCAALITTYRERGNANVIGNFSNIYAANVTRVTADGTTDLTTLEIIKDAASVTETKTNVQVGLKDLKLNDMLLKLNESIDHDDWGHGLDGFPVIVDILKGQMAPHSITIQYGNHKTGDITSGVKYDFLTDIYGHLIATEEELAKLATIPSDALPGYEGVRDWSTVVFEYDQTIGTTIHNITYLNWDPVNHTHDVFCIEGCPENATAVPCKVVLTDYKAADYFNHEYAAFACEECAHAWDEEYTEGAVPSPFYAAFDAADYTTGGTVKVNVGVKEDATINGIVAEVTYDPTVLTYVNPVFGTDTATGNQYLGMVSETGNTTEDGKAILKVVVAIPDRNGSNERDAWVTLNFTANGTTSVKLAEVGLKVTDYTRWEEGTQLDNDVLSVVSDDLAYILPNDLNLPTFTPGDVNGNGKVNVHDVILLKQALDLTETLETAQLYAANVNGDATVSVNDATAILRWTVDKTVELCKSYISPTIAQ